MLATSTSGNIAAVERLDWWSLGPLDFVVEYFFEGDHDFLTRIDFSFRSGTVAATSMPETDELDVRIQEGVHDADSIPDDTASHRAPWSQLVGKEVAWGWRLTNHQGFEDGYELEFTIPDNPSRYVLVRLIVDASMIRIQTVA